MSYKKILQEILDSHFETLLSYGQSCCAETKEMEEVDPDY